MIIYAKQPIYYMIQKHPQKIKTLYIAKDLDKKEYSKLMKMGLNIKRIPNDAAGAMCKNSQHQGFLADVEPVKLQNYREFLDFEFVIVLSSLTDIGNIGAIIRSAYALGVDAIIATGVKSLAFEGLVRSSTAVLYDMPFAIEQNSYDVLNDLKTSGFKLFGADMDGEDIKKVDIPKKRALVLGSEGEGLINRVKEKLDKIISIKMKHNFDSLNVNAAAAILIDRMR